MPRNSKRKSDQADHVEHVAEFSIRELSGARDSRSSGSDDETMHQKAVRILSGSHKSLRSEVSVARAVETSFGSVLVRGRMDAVRRTRSGFRVIEIKSRRVAESYRGLQSAHRQLQLYGDLYSPLVDKELELELVLADESGKLESRIVPSCGVPNPLQARIEAVLRRRRELVWSSEQRVRLLDWLRQDVRSYRGWQSEILSSLQSESGDRVLISSPPGTGKTRVAFHAAIHRAMQHDLPILWVTHSAEGRLTIQNEISRIARDHIPFLTAWHTTSDRMCGCESAETCERYAKADEHLFWTGKVDELEDACAYRRERSLEHSANLIIADLNYLMSDSTLTQRRVVAVIDEIHHLGGRIRENSLFFIPASHLRALTRSLPATVRAKYRYLIQPEWIDDELTFDPVPLLNQLRHDLRTRTRGIGVDALPDEITRAQFKVRNGEFIWELESCRCEARFGEWLSSTPCVIGLSGSLPASRSALQRSVPYHNEFSHVQIENLPNPPLHFVPLLRLRHPVSITDVRKAAELLISLARAHGACVLVFTPNLTMAHALESMLRARGRTVLMAEDVRGEDLKASAIAADFMLVSLGSRLAESVNPEDGVFSCGAVMSCGYHPMPVNSAKDFEEHESVWNQEISDSAARVVQAVGRLHRNPETKTPVYLFDEAFVGKQWREEWPAHWNVVSEPELMDELEAREQR